MNRSKKNSDGFSLIEVIASVAILSIVSIPLISAFATSLKINAYSVNTVEVKRNAESLMELLKATPYTQFEGILGVGTVTANGVVYALDENDGRMATEVTISEITDYKWHLTSDDMVDTLDSLSSAEDMFTIILDNDTEGYLAGGYALKLTVSQGIDDKVKLVCDWPPLDEALNPLETIEILDLEDDVVIMVVFNQNENTVIEVDNRLFGRTVRLVMANYYWVEDAEGNNEIVFNAKAQSPRVEVENGWVSVLDYSVGDYTEDDSDAANNGVTAPLAYKILIQTQTDKGRITLEGIKVTE